MHLILYSHTQHTHTHLFSTQPLKDWILFIVVAIIVAVDVVFLIIVSVDVWRLRLDPQLVFRQVGTACVCCIVCAGMF